MANVPINVTLDQNGNVRCAPDPATAGHGHNTVVWTCRTPGVELVSVDIDQGPGKPVWPGTHPTKQHNGTITADDPVEKGSGKVTFKYSVSVKRGDEVYDVDPELENEGGG